MAPIHLHRFASVPISPPLPLAAPLAAAVAVICEERPELRFGLVEDEFIESSVMVLYCEEIDGRWWKYLAERDGSGLHRFCRGSSICAVGIQSSEAPVNVQFLDRQHLLIKFGSIDGGFVKKMTTSLPFSCQSQSPSPYVD